MKENVVLGDRDSSSPTHRELDAAIGRFPDGLKARWVGTDTAGASRTGDADALWLVPGTPYRDDAAAYSAITAARTSGQRFLGTRGGFQYAVVDRLGEYPGPRRGRDMVKRSRHASTAAQL